VNENFDPQFTRMAVETDPALIAAERASQTEPFHEFDNFSFTCASSFLVEDDGAGAPSASAGAAAPAPAAGVSETELDKSNFSDDGAEDEPDDTNTTAMA
jgi:hypothetical protein